MVHHRVFEGIAGYTTPLLWANLAWLVSIVFLPFPTEIIGVNGTDEGLARFLYIGTLLLCSATLLVVVRTPGTWRDPTSSGLSITQAVTNVAMLSVALVVGVAVPVIGMWALVLLVAAPFLADRIDARRRRAR